ncbi:MAG TPA: HEAT repeat domain-containing protein [Planctomycetota bacterium]|nr:HEAT repeat domain-containing protein [Planctomycetota bacterium]
MTIAFAALLALIQEGDVDRLLKQLNHDEIEQRERAAEALRVLSPASLDIDRRLETLAREAGGELAARAERIRRLRIAGRISADPVRLVERLAAADLATRQQALAALVHRGGLGAPLVREFLQDADHNSRSWAVQIVIAADDPAYLPDLRALADHPQACWQVLPWLAARGDLAAAAPLRTRFDRGGQEMSMALEPLARLKQAEDIPRIRAVMNDQPQLIPQALRAIRGWDEAKRQLAPVIHLMAGQGITEAVLLAAEGRDPAMVQKLKGLLASADQYPAAAFALGSMGDRDAIPYLARLVRFRRLNSAIGLLGRLRSREAVWLFRRLLEDQKAPAPPDARDRAAFARALGEIGGSDAEDLLMTLLDDASEEARFDAADSLGRLQCRRALAPLVRALDDVVAFQRSVPPPPDAPLLDQYEGKAVAVEWRQGREAAARALASITGEKREGTLEEQAAAWREWWESKAPDRKK